MRFHVTSLPHTQTTKEFCWCAYTSKVVRFCDMMTSLGHEVFLYGGTQNEAHVTEFITVVDEDLHKKWFGSYNWNTTVFNNWNKDAECWQVMNEKASDAISERKKPGDFLCIIGGVCQEQIKNMHPELTAVEWGIGYEGIIPDAFHVFESNPWMHYVYGQRGIKDGRFFDTVIPNSFDEDEFIFNEKKDDYFLYLGRLTPRKGLEIVRQLARHGIKILSAGQGTEAIEGVDHLGVVRGKRKAELIANAKALIAPTTYIEPFGGVAVEAMLSGTPVITTDFGAFTETIRHGVDGFRCHTLGEFIRACDRVSDLHPASIRINAEKYLTRNVRYQYEDYFERLSLLSDKGWYHI